MKHLVLAAFFAFSSFAFAGGDHGYSTKPTAQIQGQTQFAAATAVGIGTGGAGGAGGAGGTGGSAYISPMTFNFTAPAGPSTAFAYHDYGNLPKNTPAMSTYVNTSNICDGAVGISLALPGFGGGLSAAKLRMMCEGRLNAQAHKALGQEAKAQLTMEVVQEYACEEDSTWAKIARKKGLCAPADETAAIAQTNPAFNSK